MKRILDRILGRSDKAIGATSSDTEPENPAVRPYLPPGRRLYCIGDIHGRLDLLQELQEMIIEDAVNFIGNKGLVYLGDYIDRGSQSKQVLDLLIDQPMSGFDAVHLLGNHEQTMLDFLEQPEAAAAWLGFGGQVALLSYGVGVGRVQLTRQVALLRDELEEKMPQAHLQFLADCSTSHVEGSYCFVHAGIRPGVRLEEQVPEDLLWIREQFTRSMANHGHIVVHGHSIREEVDWQPNRIGIDTGAYHSGMLTALVLEGEEQRLLQTGRPPA